MILRKLFVSLIACMLPAALAPAQQQTLHLDAAKSQVRFTLNDPIHVVHGTFKLNSGSITFNPADGSMQGSIGVDAASGESGNSTRDKKMTENQMKAASFTTVSFAPKHFRGTFKQAGESNLTVEGNFVLLGKPHAISVPMRIHWEGSTCTASGSFIVPYVEWGMKDPSNFLIHVEKQVTVDLNLSGTIAQ